MVKVETRPSSVPIGEFVVLKLVVPFTQCWRHVTTDNFFTSVSLATKLLAKQTTLVGTVRSSRRELSKLAKIAKDKMECFSTIVYKSNNCTLTIYKTKPSKKVIILCTKYKYVKINNDRKRKPETVAYCNKTK